MSTRYVPHAWTLTCAWCDHYIIVNPRGMHGSDMGAGVEAAELMQWHIETRHGKTWADYLNFLAYENDKAEAIRRELHAIAETVPEPERPTRIISV